MSSRNGVGVLGIVALIALVTVTGCSPSAAAAEGYGEAQPLVDTAKADLAERLGVGLDEIAVQGVEETEFADASLGVPEPGQMYAQVVTPGYVVRLAVDADEFVYHAAQDRVVLVQGSGEEEPAPEKVLAEAAAEAFYEWYADYPGNPLVDRAYQTSDLLTEGLVEKVDQILASFEKGGYDPFLCAQDVPSSFIVGEATVDGDRASLVVHTSFEGHAFTVELQKLEGRWLLSDVICGVGE